MEIENQEQEILMENEPFLVGGGAVDSVNGMTGDVVLTTSDIENTSDYQTGTEVTEAINMAVSDEADIRQNADNNLQSQIDGITASSDVTDIVGTYADLQNYDTSTLSDNDIIKVLQDETHQDETTYYRWNSTTQEFTLIGEEGPYYTKAQTDVLLQDKQDTLTAGNNITIDNNNVISATDTTYSDFVGTDGTAVGTAGLVPAPATTDADKYLKSDGTWEEVGGGVTELTSADYNWPTDNPSSIAAWILDDGVYSTKSAGVRFDAYMNPVYSTSFIVTTDSSNVKYAIIFNNTEGGYIRQTGVNSTNANRILTDKNLKQATGTSTTDVMSQKATTDMVFVNNDKSRVRIGYNTSSSQPGNTAIGAGSEATGTWSTGIGNYAKATGNGSVAISGVASAEGSIALGNGSIANTKGVMSIGIDSSSTFNNVKGYNDTQYRLLTGLHDPVNAHDAATKGYVDSQGGGPTVVQTTGTSTTDVMSQYATTRIVAPNNTQSAIWLNNPIGVTSYPASIPDYSVTIQPHNNVQAGATAVSSIAISGAASGHSSIAIGVNSSATQKGSIALGRGASATSVGEMNIGTNDTTAGYNSTNYRLLSGVHDPVNAHDASTKGYVDNIVVNYAGLYNAGAPTTSTVAYYLGQFYYDTTNDDIYYCSDIDTTDPDNPVYTWTALPTGGGGGDTVYSTVTTSNSAQGGAVYIGDLDTNQQVVPDPTTTDNHYKYFWALPYSTTQNPANNTVNIMGQVDAYGSNSVSILGSGASQDSVEIGNQSYAEGVNSVAIGKSSHSKNTGVAIGQSALGPNYSVSIGGNAGLYSAGSMVSCVNIGYQAGYSSQAGNNFAVNLGAFSRGTRKGEVNVGLVTGNTTGGYNDTAYRVIGGVHDGQLPQDVATVSQINATIDAINTALSTSIPHIGASS